MDDTDPIVSSEDEPLILVDGDDVATGTLGKAACHDGDGLLHRAFSLFVFGRDGRLLLQQRSASKRLWPLYWSNSCCSHPRAGETMEAATTRRLKEELGIRSELEFVYKFRYHASYGRLGAEHELCWVYVGRSEDAVIANRNEIAATRFLTAEELRRELVALPERYTPWFKLEWHRLEQEHGKLLLKYLAA